LIHTKQTKQMNFQTATETELQTEGYTITKLPTRKPSKSDTWVNSVRGGSSRFYASTGAGRNGRLANKNQQSAQRKAA
jgi:hypothetical protein